MEREIKTYRKPYNREVKRSWWIARREYVMYMIRELTAVTNLWIGAGGISYTKSRHDR